MRIKRLFVPLLVGAITLNSCNVDELTENLETESNQTISEDFTPEEIDWSVFNYLGKDAVEKIKASAGPKAQTRTGEHPGTITAVRWTPSSMMLPMFDATITVVIESTEGETLTLIAYDPINEVNFSQTPVTTTGATGSYSATQVVTVGTFSDPDRYNVRPVELRYEYTGSTGITETRYLYTFYQNPTTNLFAIDLINDYGVINKGETPVAITRVGSYPNTPTQQAQFRATASGTDVNVNTPLLIGLFGDPDSIVIERNSSTNPRTIIFEYRLRDNNAATWGNWLEFDQAIQLGISAAEVIVDKAEMTEPVLGEEKEYTFYLYGSGLEGAKFRIYTHKHSTHGAGYYPTTTPATAVETPLASYDGMVKITIPAASLQYGWSPNYLTNIREQYQTGTGIIWVLEYDNGNDEWITLPTLYPQRTHYLGMRNSVSLVTGTNSWELKYAGVFPSNTVEVFAGTETGTMISPATYPLTSVGSNALDGNISIPLAPTATERNVYLWYTIGTSELIAPAYTIQIPGHTGKNWRRWGDPANQETSDWSVYQIPYVVQR